MFRGENLARDIVPYLLDDILPDGRGLLAMVKAYLDRGAKPQAGGVMCVAAALFDPIPYKRFCRQWKPFLGRWNAQAFHATDFYTGWGEFKRKRPDGTVDPHRQRLYDEDSRRLPSMVAAFVRQICLVSFRQKEFEAVAPAAWRARFGDVNGVAAQMVAGAIGHWANETAYRGRVAYVIEDGDDGREMDGALKRLYCDEAHRAHTRMSAHPLVVPKGQARGLEAADFVAWHWNKYFADTVDAPRRSIRKDLAAFLESSEDKVHVFLYTGETLEQFLVSHGCSRRAVSGESQF